MKWIAVIALGVVMVASLADQDGRVTSPKEFVESLANRPEVGGRFEDNATGRFDATVFLFTCIILAPIAGLALLLVLAIMLMALEGTVFQVSRRVGVPDGLTAVFVMGAGVGLAWSQTELWLPRSIRLIGMIARAWVVSTT